MNSFKSAFGLGGSNSKTSLAGWEAIAQTEGPVPDPHASLESGHAPTGDNNSSSGGENNGGLVQKAWRSITSSLPQFPEFSYLQRMIGFTLFFGAGALMIALVSSISPLSTAGSMFLLVLTTDLGVDKCCDKLFLRIL